MHRRTAVTALAAAPLAGCDVSAIPRDPRRITMAVSRDVTTREPPPTFLTTNQIDAAVQACMLGLGWGQFFDYHVRDELRAGTLLEDLPDHHAARTPAHIVYPQARLLSPNVRAFLDFATPKLRLVLCEEARCLGVSGFGFQVSGFKFQVSSFKFWVSRLKSLNLSVSRFPPPNYTQQTLPKAEASGEDV